jgi:hypothetical protein
MPWDSRNRTNQMLQHLSHDGHEDLVTSKTDFSKNSLSLQMPQQKNIQSASQRGKSKKRDLTKGIVRLAFEPESAAGG